MLVISYTVAGITNTKEFSDTIKGNRESIKFVQKLRDERVKHPWYYNLKAIEVCKAKLSDYKLGRKTKKRFQLEVELKILERQRADYLEILEIQTPPDPLVIKIFKQ